MTHTIETTDLDWSSLADAVLGGHVLTEAEGLAVLRCPDEELLDLMSAAYKVRRRHFGNNVHFYFLMNAKSGLCQEDCGYCSQSKVSDAEIPKYNLLDETKLLEGARIAASQQARTYCIVISGRAPTEREMAAVADIVPKIKQHYDLKICACLGLLSGEQARQLKECGVDRVNHNLNTSEQYYDEICSTHTFEDRVETLSAVREAGLEICSGGIVGMGETDVDVVRMAHQLREQNAQSIPINFLIPIAGTPLAQQHNLNPRYCLKVLALFRLANPDRELRIAGGREVHLGSLQPLGLYAANSLFVGDYLTTKGQAPVEDYRMIEDLGFQVVRDADQAPADPSSFTSQASAGLTVIPSCGH